MMNGRKNTDDGQRFGTATKAILKIIKSAEYPLSYEEIGAITGHSKSGVAYHVGVLLNTNLVTNKTHSARSTK